MVALTKRIMSGLILVKKVPDEKECYAQQCLAYQSLK
jgi:hypothetical protein